MSMRGVFVLAAVLVILVAAGVLTITWGDGSATVKINKEVARQRGQQVLEEARAIGSGLDQNLKNTK